MAVVLAQVAHSHAAVVQVIPDRGVAAIQAIPGRAVPVDPVDLDLDVHLDREVLGQDVRRSDDRTQDLPEAVVQTLDQLDGKARLVARFPAEVESEGLRNQEVLGVLDRDVRRCRREDLDRDVPVDREVPDRAVPVALATCCQDVRHCQIHRMEERCNTRFQF